MNIKCKILGHDPDLVKLVDNSTVNKDNYRDCTTTCKKCNEIFTYDECWKKYSYKIITILQKKLMELLK